MTHTRRAARCFAAVLTLALSMPGNSRAMEFGSKTHDDLTVIVGSGEIRSGDAERLVGEVLAFQRGAKLLLSLHSAGGSIVASESLAAVVGRYRLPVIVAAGNMCASGCFLVFVASPLKMFFPSSHIGVHSASLDAKETMSTMAMTTTMARSASDLGVPPAIIGKMVTTVPGDMAWLSADEIITIGGKLLAEPTPPAPQYAQAPPPAAPNVLPNTPAAPLASVQPAVLGAPSNTPSASSARPPSGNAPADEQSPSFQEGRANRTAWEHWFAALAGDAKLGAEYWTGERSKRKPGNCVGTPDFQQGCLAARQWLAGPDTKRKTDPQYWLGWNSL